MSVVITGAVLFGPGCGGESGPGAAEHWPVDGGPDGAGGADSGPVIAACTPSPRTSEDLPPRVDLSSQIAVMTGAPARQFVQTSELFQRFVTSCGQCHVSIASGGFQARDVATFVALFDERRLGRLNSDNPDFVMPPERVPFSSRATSDPVYQLEKRLEAWLAQGRPADMFEFGDAVASTSAAAGFYGYSTLSNMGDCIPGKTMYASSPSGEMDAKDKLFADATELPANLADTDLTTFDGATLAANGVIAFRPTYALWSAGSRKLRYVRVPKGTSIKFDKATQSFDIPPNTRFYKTFFRKVLDTAGRTSYRKMETRLILTRPDGLEADGTTPRPTALFGTYVWSDDEMSAQLRTVPYRDGTGFSDLTETYWASEIEHADLLENLPPGAGSLVDKIQKVLDDPRSLDKRLHYAVPGSKRCVQCHQGSPTRDFVLGFIPLQIAQREAGTGGTYDPVDADELDQLQRFIDYGLITGMASPADVVKLEDSQPPRKYRTDGELKAQAYMLGNCAHCHNPRGFPSIAKPELATVLNFLPGSTPEAGIFQFDLDTMSPVRRRGANQSVRMPYITPSLRDYPVADDTGVRLDNGFTVEPSSGGAHEVTWTPKYGFATCDDTSSITRSYCGKRTSGPSFVAAPWRSLIYRNVDTPFPYFDDYVPFPRMPMNTAGFDCRAPRIMAEWMVGLPAVLKPEYAGMDEDTLPVAQADGSYPRNFIDAEQPYEAVGPDDSRYAVAEKNAGNRLEEYRNSSRFPYCPDELSVDIIDPLGGNNEPLGSPRQPNVFYPLPVRFLYGAAGVLDPAHPGAYLQAAIGVPFHSEWFDYDPTEPKGDWFPRRTDWSDVLQQGIPDRNLPAGFTVNESVTLEKAVTIPRRRLIAAIGSAELTEELRNYAVTPVPYGLWQVKDECKDKLARAGVKTVAQVLASVTPPPPAWMVQARDSLPPDAPVYEMAPGFALYRHICFNCHGPRADGKGLQADALASSSEGRTRPADFLDGLFGPADLPASNLLRVFGKPPGATGPTDPDPLAADQWASRYMSWMTLGGTLQLIPQDVVNQVQATSILGVRRPNLSNFQGEAAGVSANMLNLAKGLCAEVLPDFSSEYPVLAPLRGIENGNILAPENYPLLRDRKRSSFIFANGDWEMWMNLCSSLNRKVVRVYAPDAYGNNLVVRALYYADDGHPDEGPQHRFFPADQRVWDHNQVPQVGVTADNFYPACSQGGTVKLPGEYSVPAGRGAQGTAILETLARSTMPVCPEEFLKNQAAIMWMSGPETTPEQEDAVKQWALHGGINAAMSVFSFLEQSAKQGDLAHKGLPPYYNECQKLP